MIPLNSPTCTMDCSCLNLRFSFELDQHNYDSHGSIIITVLIKWQNVLCNRHNIFIECSNTTIYIYICHDIYVSIQICPWYVVLVYNLSDKIFREIAGSSIS